MQTDHPLERQLVSIMASNREGSHATRRKRAQVLAATARELVAKYGLQKWANLKSKHVGFLVETWKGADRGRRTIQGKLSHFRWLVQKIGKANLLPRSNEQLGIAPGPRHTRAGKIISDEAFAVILERIPDARIRLMALLARHLGLRFKEAALFRPWRDWDGAGRVWIKRGTKGGRPRYLLLHNANHREVLQAVRRLTSHDRGLIPADIPTYEKWRQHVYRVLRAAGLRRSRDRVFHDLRRTYLVRRMEALIQGSLNTGRAAALVAREAGHHREEVLRWYLDCGSTAGRDPPCA